MSTSMNTEELVAFYENLSNLAAEGKEEEAREYLEHHVQRLPEELKNEILGLMFFAAIADEAREIKAIADIQEEGLFALEILEALKKEIEARQAKED